MPGMRTHICTHPVLATGVWLCLFIYFQYWRLSFLMYGRQAPSLSYISSLEFSSGISPCRLNKDHVFQLPVTLTPTHKVRVTSDHPALPGGCSLHPHPLQHPSHSMTDVGSSTLGHSPLKEEKDHATAMWGHRQGLPWSLAW